MTFKYRLLSMSRIKLTNFPNERNIHKQATIEITIYSDCELNEYKQKQLIIRAFRTGSFEKVQ